MPLFCCRWGRGAAVFAVRGALILRRIPYRIVAKPLAVPAYRQIGFALRDRRTASRAVRQFIDYLPYRERGASDAV